MSFRIKEENYQKILSMFKEGKPYDEIAGGSGLSKKSAYLAIGLGDAVSEEMMRTIAHRVADDGYTSIAEYAVDLMVDAVFKESKDD